MAAIRMEHVTVEIPIFNAKERSLRSNIVSAATGGRIKSEGGKKRNVRAIDDLNLHLENGTRVGLIGHNGAGKSTILRVIAGIYEPTAGTVDVQGSVATMFDIGFGMDEDATGWENINLRGRILGHSPREIKARANDIAEASELGEYLDMPIRTYSSGMTTRLAFAISTSIDPDILLVDEGIGAGDAAFLARAKVRMQQFVGGANLLVVASHSDDLLREWCTTGIWMEHGKMRMHGEIEDVLRAYHDAVD
ncbi:ABC transporter ATP-binding protein [Rhizobium sp. CFBP 8762]|uniref:ABC transporter ATP-binding protein n=1 Tax=Rhizobium sp. CFBP 8762 TaxID=2775279 RepID=UPI001785E2A7|nr:ABC transporter ATP-binding protein [Rhizobium sp. CFBP 8762]MBD8555637.1 ABC transporter ATP-binding protein [Rhizobium sp. CFBP 8762]